MKKRILLKYGGNAMQNDEMQQQIMQSVAEWHKQGHEVIIVHGGGPFIKKALEKAGIVSEFIGGQRFTSPKALEVVEGVLKGHVNARLVALLNRAGQKAVGISGKDGKTAMGKKRYYFPPDQPAAEKTDMGQVADIAYINTKLPELLLENNYIPVVACIATDENGTDYNVNADMMAGHFAAAMKADYYIVMTDVDGLLRNKDNPDSLIKELKISAMDELVQSGAIVGGMIPKTESCQIALEGGAKAAMIINGTKPLLLQNFFDGDTKGTFISRG